MGPTLGFWKKGVLMNSLSKRSQSKPVTRSYRLNLRDAVCGNGLDRGVTAIWNGVWEPDGSSGGVAVR